MATDEIVTIDKSLLLGVGGWKSVYIDPRDSKRCIKITHNGKMPRDVRQEKAYRKARKLRRLPHSELMAEYYGEVKTDLGTGYVYERSADYDGATSATIEQLIQWELEARKQNKTVAEFLATEKQYPLVFDALMIFREKLFEEKIIIPDMGAFNYTVEFSAPDKWRIRIIDDIGCPTLIPLMNYVDYFAQKHVKKRWRLFIAEIRKLWPDCLTDDEAAKLLS